MIQTNQATLIDFQEIQPTDRALYERCFPDAYERGCEFSFANLYLWGQQRLAVLNGQIVLLSRFGQRCVYPFPIGDGDKKAALDAVLADARDRGVPCCITGLSAHAKQQLQEWYPNTFCYRSDEGSFDYVYAIDDLCELTGKKYHAKRNHLNRFWEVCPDAVAVPLDESMLTSIGQMADEWYAARLRDDPQGDYRMEQEALARALANFHALGLEGLALMDGERVLAFTMASRLTEDTMDVHFEKARADVAGAYAAINCEFARYIRSKYPSVRFLDREEDMGLDGLRRAKQSYHPHHMVEKWRACPREDGCDED